VGVSGELDRQEIRPRIEPDEKLRTLALDRLRQPVGEEGGGDCGLGAHAGEANARCGPQRRRAADAALQLKPSGARPRSRRRLLRS